MGSEEVILVDFWPSMFGMRLRIALAEKGVKYEYKEEPMMTGIRSQLVLQMNPIHKKIPILIHNGNPVCESLIAVEYIDGVWNDKASLSLLPSDPYHRAQAKFWADYIDKKLFPAWKKICRMKEDDETREEAKKDFLEVIKVLEAELGEKSYFGGHTFGFVDIALIPFYCWFYTLERFGKFDTEAEYPRFIAWAKRCMERESVYKSLPEQHKIYDFVPIYRKRMEDKEKEENGKL